MAPSFTSPKQALEQGVCGQHGWSSRYFRDPATGCWCVEVRWGVGPDAGRVFASEDASEDTKPGAKRGHAAAATVALAGLADVLAVANAKPAVTIEAAFGPRFDATCRVVNTWSAFWALCASAAPPPVVAIDVEGNLRAPPVLVQACAWCDAGEDLSVCVLEAPSATDGLSEDLRRLLADDRVVKVFCDGSGGADKRSLGVDSREGACSSVVDLEAWVIADRLAQEDCPFGIVRAVLDTAEEDLPLDFAALSDEDGGVARSRVLTALLRHPFALRGLLRLRSRVRLCGETLGSVAEEWVSRL